MSARSVEGAGGSPGAAMDRLDELQGAAELDIRSKVRVVADYLHEQVVGASEPLDPDRAGGLVAILRDVDKQLGENIEESERLLPQIRQAVNGGAS